MRKSKRDSTSFECYSKPGNLVKTWKNQNVKMGIIQLIECDQKFYLRLKITAAKHCWIQKESDRGETAKLTLYVCASLQHNFQLGSAARLLILNIIIFDFSWKLLPCEFHWHWIRTRTKLEMRSKQFAQCKLVQNSVVRIQTTLFAICSLLFIISWESFPIENSTHSAIYFGEHS
jgi:hypothetical protein